MTDLFSFADANPHTTAPAHFGPPRPDMMTLAESDTLTLEHWQRGWSQPLVVRRKADDARSSLAHLWCWSEFRTSDDAPTDAQLTQVAAWTASHGSNTWVQA